jgi:hypothetical protein
VLRLLLAYSTHQEYTTFSSIVSDIIQRIFNQDT